MSLSDLLVNKGERNMGKSGYLNRELNLALRHAESDFTGSFYHCSTNTSAPNPALNIEGLGSIGLPLSERDAHSIISRAAQAPFGKGTETIVDTSVRDTFEIDPARGYVNELAAKHVWSALGVAPYTTEPRCELYKLLLYQKGSHFLPHQDTAKAEGMFSTIIIVLPSAFQGGEVLVSHAGKTQVLDVSQTSAHDTSVLAWYTDVTHEVKPITSGYRLALSYNLIHTSPNKPPPALPDPHAITPLHQCLRKWRYNGFASDPGEYIAYLLDHEYSASDLDKGQAALKGRDANTIAQLLPIAESLGIIVCLGNLTRTVRGTAEDNGESYYKRRHGYYDDEEEVDDTPAMGDEIDEDTYEISNMVRIDDGEDDREWDDFEIDPNDIIPVDPFSCDKPHGQKYEGYMGNGPGTLEQWYQSSVMVLFCNEDFTPDDMILNGPDLTLSQLPVSSEPDANSEGAVAAVLGRLDRTKQGQWMPQHEAETNSQSAAAIVKHALAWKRAGLWNRAIRHCASIIEDPCSAIGEALGVFDLETIKPGLIELAKQRASLTARFNIARTICSKAGQGVESEWAEEFANAAISSYRAFATSDIPTLIAIVQERGPRVIQEHILPHIPLTGTYAFLTALGKALHEYRSNTQDGANESIAQIIRGCLSSAVQQWEAAKAIYPTSAGMKAQYERLSELVHFCVLIDDLERCNVLADLVSKGTYETCIVFARAMNNALAKLPQSEGEAQRKAQFRETIGSVMNAAIQKWESIYSYGNDNTTKLKRLRHLLPFCFNIGQPTLSLTFFDLIQRSATYEVLVDFGKVLHGQIARIPQTDAGAGPAVGDLLSKLRKVVQLSIDAAVSKWESDVPTSYGGYYATTETTGKEPNAKTNRICELVDLCFEVGDLSPCTALLNNLLQFTPTVTFESRLTEIYTPLLPQLNSTLAGRGKSMTLEPFSSTYRPLDGASHMDQLSVQVTHN